MGVASMVLMAACGGGASGGLQTLEGQIQIFNNTPVFIGVYDGDVWSFGQSFGYIQRHRDVMVAPGAINTVVVVPGVMP